MRPGLVPGDEFVATGARSPVRGEVVALPHPQRDDFWLVKRMLAGPGDHVEGHGALAPDLAWVASDNQEVDSQDSRAFGPVPIGTLQPMVSTFDPETFVEAVELLAAEEPAFAGILAEHGVPPFWSRPEGFATVVWLILEQQVSLESGAAMYRRMHGLLGSMTPAAVLDAGPDALRSIGVTRQKAGYLIDLASGIVSGAFDIHGLTNAAPIEARAALLGLKGIGPWTADAYLLSALRLPDVFPIGDRALQVGTAETLGLGSVPARDDLELLSLPWRPVRAAAARLIWHAYLERRGRSEPTSALASPSDTRQTTRRRVET